LAPDADECPTFAERLANPAIHPAVVWPTDTQLRGDQPDGEEETDRKERVVDDQRKPEGADFGEPLKATTTAVLIIARTKREIGRGFFGESAAIKMTVSDQLELRPG
jgi:hypothetical protein